MMATTMLKYYLVHHEKPVATLERYIGVLDESYAQKLENLLMSFSHQTHFKETQSMVNTLNTDHFHNIHD